MKALTVSINSNKWLGSFWKSNLIFQLTIYPLDLGVVIYKVVVDNG